MAEENRLERGARELGDFLVKRLQITLIKQGHVATSGLVQSIVSTVELALGGLDIVERHVFYGNFVDTGRKPGTKRIPVDVIEEWLKQRRFEWAINNTRGMAFAVQESIFQKGIKPSGWLTTTLNESAPIITTEVNRVISEHTEILITNLVRFAQKELNTAA